MERVKIMPVLLSNEDGDILLEALESITLKDIPPDKRERVRSLCDRFKKEFNVGGDVRAA
jgi:hypothetical protein